MVDGCGFQPLRAEAREQHMVLVGPKRPARFRRASAVGSKTQRGRPRWDLHQRARHLPVIIAPPFPLFEGDPERGHVARYGSLTRYLHRANRRLLHWQGLRRRRSWRRSCSHCTASEERPHSSDHLPVARTHRVQRGAHAGSPLLDTITPRDHRPYRGSAWRSARAAAPTD